MASNTTFSRRLLVVSLAFLAMAAGFWLADKLSTPASDTVPPFQGTMINPARQIALPELVKHDGQPFTNDDLKGHWTLVFFGYTRCPDICPMTMNVLAEAKKKATAEFPQVVFVSVDPQRDTVEMLGDYVRYFDPEFTGVTGEENMIQALTLQTSVLYMKVPGSSGKEDDYLVDHSSSIILINPKGQLAAFLAAPHTPTSIIDSVEKITADN